MEKKQDIDWNVLKGSLIAFGLCLVLCGTLSAGSYYYYTKSGKEFINYRNQFQSISRRYLDIDQEEKLLLEYYPQFVKLYNKGVIGREKRLNWIEALRQSGEKVNIPSLTYTIDSQEEFIPSYGVNYSGYKLYSSKMVLVLGLLHEGDLFSLVNELNRNADGSYTIDECSFRMNGRNIEFNRDHANVSASCTLHWITINLPDGRVIEIG